MADSGISVWLPVLSRTFSRLLHFRATSKELDRTKDDLAAAKGDLAKAKGELEAAKGDLARYAFEIDGWLAEINRLGTERDELWERIRKLEENSPEAEFIGWYMDELGLMPRITGFLRDASLSNTSVFIVTDFAAYGAITWNRMFNDQHEQILELCRIGKANNRKLRMVVNSRAVNSEVLERQYPTQTFSNERAKLSAKLSQWIESDLFRLLAAKDQQEPGNLTKLVATKGVGMNRRLFIDGFLEFNERLIEIYIEAGARVTPRPKMVPLHGWFCRREMPNAEMVTDGIFGIADSRAVWNEPGFAVRRNVANKLLSIIEDIADDHIHSIGN